MINVLHLINITGGGGTESYIYNLAKKLHNGKCKFFLAYSQEGPSLKLFENLGIETIRLDMNGPFDLKAAKKLKQICQDNNIDVVHTHFLRENYISILSKLFANRVKLINTRHMLIKNSRSVSTFNRIMTRFNFRVIAISRAVEKILLQESIRPKKIEVIYTGIDCHDWHPSKNNNFRREFNLDEEDLLIVSVARFTEEKGHEFFLRSIEELKRIIPTEYKNRIKFILVGTGVLLEDSVTLSKKLDIYDNIIFTGYRSDINNILRDCDIYVCHSRSEAFGISILEALASGLAVVSTDSGGTREIVDGEANTGVLVDYGKEGQMAQALVRLIEDEDLRKTYKRNGLNLVKGKYSLDYTIEETYNLYSL